MGALNYFFPIPRTIAHEAVGIDVSEESIKYLELVPGPTHYHLGKFGEVKLASGVVEGGIIKKQSELVDALISARKITGFENAFISLPEDQAYLVRMKVPNVSKKELRGSIELQLEEYVPQAGEIVFDYQILKNPQGEKGEYEVVVSAMPLRIITPYLEAFKKAGFLVTGVEIEAQAVARAVVPFGDARPHMIVDLGRGRTGFAIVSEGNVSFSSTIAVGGESITKAIAKALNVTADIAEAKKVERGISRAPEDSELYAAIVPVVSAVRDEISKQAVYWQTHKDESGVSHRKIEKVILCGGQSNLKGISDYLEAGLGINVALANPWINILDFSRGVPELSHSFAVGYSTAVGLAMRGIYSK